MALPRLAGQALFHGAKRFGFLPEVARSVMPQSGMDWAMRLAPEALGAAAGFAYGGVPGALEELGLGLGGSLITAGGTAAGAYGVSRALGQNRRARQQLMNSSAGIGDMAGGMGFSMFGPRPFTDAMRREQEELYLAQQQAAQQAGPVYDLLAGSPALQNYNALLGG